MITLKRNDMTAAFDTKGAELKSLKLLDTEFIWHADPDIWGSSAPLLFPFCVPPKKGRYTYEGKEYTMTPDCYASASDFSVESLSCDSVTLLHTPSEESLAGYPFRYELRAKYTLTDSGLNEEYTVTNTDSKIMYFSIGSHEGYYTPEGIEDYDIIFPERETLSSLIGGGGLLPIIKNSTHLPLYDKYFVSRALFFTTLKSRSATLRNRKNGRFVRVDFPDMPYFALWHPHASPFICLEPWCDMHNFEDPSSELVEKRGIMSLEAGESRTFTHTISVGFEF